MVRADNEGLRAAFRAFLLTGGEISPKVPGQPPAGAVLPGVNLSAVQLFFVGTAQPWCQKMSEKKEDLKHARGIHSINRFRVLVPMSNSDDFRAAFKCQEGSAMAPKKQCRLW